MDDHSEDLTRDLESRAATARDASLPEIEGYRVLERLGEGGMGRVFLAEDLALRRRVAIKLISEELSRDAVTRGRFLREASAGYLDSCTRPFRSGLSGCTAGRCGHRGGLRRSYRSCPWPSGPG